MTVAFYIMAFVYAAILLLRRWLALAYARSLPTPPAEPLAADTLTVAQAILSGDPLLESRLEMNLKGLEGQRFLWLIDESDTEARRIATELARPQLQVELCPPCPDATNPKLWKLHRAARLVGTPFFAVVDDDTLLPAASAAALVEAAKTHTVATGLPCYQDGGDVPSRLLAHFVNNNSAFTYLGTSHLLRPFTLNGMGYVMRTEELERIGHFEPILNELTDDLALATLVLKLGGTIHQSAAPLLVQTGVRDFRHYWQMMHRWYVFTLLLLKRQSIAAQMLIFGLHGLLPLLLPAMLILGMANPTLPVVIVWGGLVMLRSVVIVTTFCRFFGKDKIFALAYSAYSEFLQPLHLIHALCSRTIRWRTRLYKVRDTNDFHEVGG